VIALLAVEQRISISVAPSWTQASGLLHIKLSAAAALKKLSFLETTHKPKRMTDIRFRYLFSQIRHPISKRQISPRVFLISLTDHLSVLWIHLIQEITMHPR
tara:strand:- start:85 stop:390 length:306 start_codon:yes stop_codon:yes gene_type:complete